MTQNFWRFKENRPDFISLEVDSVWITKDGKRLGLVAHSSGLIGCYVDGIIRRDVFVEVTGIKLSENGTTADVQYTYKSDSITPFGVVLGYKPEIDNSNCHFTLYDDGWRLK